MAAGAQDAPKPAAEKPAPPPGKPTAGKKPAGEKPAVEVVGDQESKPSKPAAPKVTETPGMVTNVFFDEDIRQALSDMATQAKVAIIPDSTVQGTVSAEFENVPVEDALQRVALVGGFVYKKINGAYLVGTPDPDNPSFRLLAETQIVDLDYATAAEVQALLPPYLARYVKAEAGGGGDASRSRRPGRSLTRPWR
jgi:type II secretory pathway component HofQ